jgi:hypothetical protein
MAHWGPAVPSWPLLDPELAGEEVATGAGDEADGEEATGDGAACY